MNNIIMRSMRQANIRNVRFWFMVIWSVDVSVDCLLSVLLLRCCVLSVLSTRRKYRSQCVRCVRWEKIDSWRENIRNSAQKSQLLPRFRASANEIDWTSCRSVATHFHHRSQKCIQRRYKAIYNVLGLGLLRPTLFLWSTIFACKHEMNNMNRRTNGLQWRAIARMQMICSNCHWIVNCGANWVSTLDTDTHQI